MRQLIRTLCGLGAVMAVLSILPGCGGSYAAPGRAADMSLLTSASSPERMPSSATEDPSIDRTEILLQPRADFPARIAVVRIQAPNYRSYTARGHGSGAYSIVSTRDIEVESDMERLHKMPQVAGIAVLNHLVLGGELKTDYELRRAAANLQADMLLVYTVDTIFAVEDTIEPLGVVTLGLFPSKQARINSTMSAVLMDTRTGFIYGLAEGSSAKTQLANHWTSESAVDQSRRRAERDAFLSLLDNIESMWTGVVNQHAPNAPIEQARTSAR